MVAHGALGPVRVARGDRLEYPAMRFICLARPPRRRASCGAAPAATRPSAGMDRGEDRIARHQRQHIVEIDIGALEALEIADRLAVCLERLRETLPYPRASRSAPRGGPARPRRRCGRSGSRGRRPAPTIMCRAGPASASMTNCGVGRVTRARSPELTSTSPILLRCNNASRIDGRPTPNCRMSSRSDGSRSASASSPVTDHLLEMIRHLVGQLPLLDLNPNHLAYLLYQHITVLP